MNDDYRRLLMSMLLNDDNMKLLIVDLVDKTYLGTYLGWDGDDFDSAVKDFVTKHPIILYKYKVKTGSGSNLYYTLYDTIIGLWKSDQFDGNRFRLCVRTPTYYSGNYSYWLWYEMFFTRTEIRGYVSNGSRYGNENGSSEYDNTNLSYIISQNA